MSYIKKSEVMKICEDYSTHCFNSNDSNGQDIADRILDDVVELPIYAVVPISVYEQVKWERDLAIEQLQSYGVCFAEKKELAEVKHGSWVETKEWYFDEYAQSEYQRKCYECSICKRTELHKEPYCHCGAKMDGGKTK